MNLEEKPLKILTHLSISNTEVRLAIFEILITRPDEIHSIRDVIQKLKSHGKLISPSAVVQNLLMFQVRGLIKPVDMDINTQRKRGRPESRFKLNQDLVARILINHTKP